jgi:hypothetical protein
MAAVQAVVEAEAELMQIEAHIRYLLGLGGIFPSRKNTDTEPSKKI